MMVETQELCRREATRAIPGIMAARLRNDAAGAAVLMRDYQIYADAQGLTKAEAWMVLWTATMHWTLELAKGIADAREVDVEAYVQMIGTCAAAWEADLGVHGGE